MDAAGDQLLAHAAFAANQDRGIARRRLGDLVGHLANDRALADDLALHAQPLAKLHVFRADLGQVLGQFLAAFEILQGHGHRVGHGQRELQVVGIGHAFRIDGIKMDQAQDLPATAHRGDISRSWCGFRPGCRGCPANCRP